MEVFVLFHGQEDAQHGPSFIGVFATLDLAQAHAEQSVNPGLVWEWKDEEEDNPHWKAQSRNMSIDYVRIQKTEVQS